MKYQQFFKSGLSVFSDLVSQKNQDRFMLSFIIAASVGAAGMFFDVDKKIDDYAHQKFETTVFQDLGQYRFNELKKSVQESFGDTILSPVTKSTMEELNTDEYKKSLKEKGPYSFYELEKDALEEFKKDAGVEEVQKSIKRKDSEIVFEPEPPKEKIRIVLDAPPVEKPMPKPPVEVQETKENVVKSIQDMRAKFVETREIYSIVKPK